ncbi:MAG: hypothetical protein Q9208_007635 [Pyrenodesmia sp. 3 TL-2023]
MSSEPSRPTLPTTLIGISTKMYFDLPSTTTYISSLPLPPASTALFIIPSFPALPAAAAQIKKLRSSTQPAPTILLGAQNCSHADSGAYTGEVSALMLKQIGCDVVELGHAERRAAPFNETDEMVAEKAKAAVRNQLIPLICIGERNKSSIVSEGVGIAIRECARQVNAVLDAVEADRDVIFAYEPVWAIGASEPAGKDHVVAVVGQLSKMVQGRRRGGEVRWLYGGSAGPGIWQGLKGGVDGLFLGRFAHEVENVKRILKEVEES